MELTNTDLRYMIKFIDVVADRGSIKGDELKSVGTFRDNLVELVEKMEVPPVEVPKAATTTTAETEYLRPKGVVPAIPPDTAKEPKSSKTASKTS